MTGVGIMGLGFMGRKHYDSYQRIPGAQVVAVCDADPRRAAGDLTQGWGNLGDALAEHLPMDRITGYTDPIRLIEDPAVEVVDICLPTPAHLQVASLALAAGKHVLCEKPLARTSMDAGVIADAAARASGLFMPAMCMRFWPQWEWLKQSVTQARFGKVRSASFQRLGEMPSGWFGNGALSGGALLDLHLHDTDFIYYLFGRPLGVFSRGYTGHSGEIDHILTQYLYNDNKIISAEGSWMQAKGFGFRMAYTVNFESATADFDMTREHPLVLHTRGKSEPIAMPQRDGYEGELAYFLECVRTGQKPRRVTAADAVTSIQIVEAERHGIETGAIALL